MPDEPSVPVGIPEPLGFRPVQLAFLAAAVFIVSAGYGGLLPVLPTWLAQQMPQADAMEVARHVGFLSGAYAAGVLVGAPLWGMVSDRVGRPNILIAGMVGYVASMLVLLLPAMGSLSAIYVLRAAAGLCVAAVVPVVSAIVAEHTPQALRARRFAWLSAASLVGFLFGPPLNALADGLAGWLRSGGNPAPLSASLVVVLSAGLGAVIMLGLAWILPIRLVSAADSSLGATGPKSVVSLLLLSGVVMFVLSGIEIGIVLQGQQHANLSTQQIALMFAECSLVMLAINAVLFFTSLLDKVAARVVIAFGLLIGMAGLAIMALHRTDSWMYLGVSLTSAGTGLFLPVITFLAAGATRQKLGATMGGLAAAAGFGQTLGSAAGGWLFGALAQHSFGWLALPLALTLFVLLARPGWWVQQPIDARGSRRMKGQTRATNRRHPVNTV